MVVRHDDTDGHCLARLPERLRARLALMALSAAILTWFAAASSAQVPDLPLDGPQSPQVFNEHIAYYLDPDWSGTVQDAAGFDWQPLETSQPDFGYTRSKVWLRLGVENLTEDTDEWVLRLHDNFKQVMDVWIDVPGEGIDHILSLDQTSTFGERPLPFPQMTAPFALPPGARATLYVSFWSEGTSLLPVSIESAARFQQTSGRIYARNFVFYGVIAGFIIAALGGFFFFSSLVAGTFAAYALFALLYVMHTDGTAFQYLYPNLPGFNSIASVVWGGGFIFWSALYARTYLRTRIEFPLIHLWLGVVMMLCVLLWAAMFFYDPQQIKKLFVMMSLVGLLSCLIAGIVVARRHFSEVRFFVMAWTVPVLSSLLLNLIHVYGVEVRPEFQTNTMRFAMVLDAALMGLAIIDRYNQMRDARQAALQASLETAERNLSLSRRMNDLERQMDILDGVSRQRDEAFANAIHDLRQPLHALRLRIKGEASGHLPAAGDHTETDRGFDYLEGLIGQYLDEARGSRRPAHRIGDRTERAQLSLDEVLAGVHEMFGPDAEEKGLTFRYVPTGLSAEADPLVLMRIMSNLVANAVKYTESGRILMGCRRRGDMVRIEVHDTGPGLGPRAFDLARSRDIRLNKAGGRMPEGEGYGLAIAGELAQQNGGTLDRVACSGSGFGVGVTLPRPGMAAG
ncbi:MAG: sensor histidine kinase [Pseudooceanicola sp.]